MKKQTCNKIKLGGYYVIKGRMLVAEPLDFYMGNHLIINHKGNKVERVGDNEFIWKSLIVVQINSFEAFSDGNMQIGIQNEQGEEYDLDIGKMLENICTNLKICETHEWYRCDKLQFNNMSVSIKAKADDADGEALMEMRVWSSISEAVYKEFELLSTLLSAI